MTSQKDQIKGRHHNLKMKVWVWLQFLLEPSGIKMAPWRTTQSHKRPQKESKNGPRRSLALTTGPRGATGPQGAAGTVPRPPQQKSRVEKSWSWRNLWVGLPSTEWTTSLTVVFERITSAKPLPAWTKRDKDSSNREEAIGHPKFCWQAEKSTHLWIDIIFHEKDRLRWWRQEPRGRRGSMENCS